MTHAQELRARAERLVRKNWFNGRVPAEEASRFRRLALDVRDELVRRGEQERSAWHYPTDDMEPLCGSDVPTHLLTTVDHQVSCVDCRQARLDALALEGRMAS